MARDFDGSADYLVSTTLPVTAYPFTFACWANVDNNNSGHLVGLTDNTDTTRLSIFFVNGGQLAAGCVDDLSVNRDWRTTATGATGVWHSCVGVFTDATDFKSFLNGVSTGSYVFTGNAAVNSANRFNIGALLRSSLAGPVDGRIAEVGVWNVALTQAEVDMLAAGYSPMMVRNQSLVAYFPLHGRAGAGGDEENWVAAWALTQVSSPGLADHPRIIYPGRRSVGVPAATGTTISATLASHTYTPRAPALAARTAPGAASHTYTAQAPQLAGRVAAAAAAHTYTGQAPALRAALAAAAAAHTYTGQAPAVLSGNAVAAATAAHAYLGLAPQLAGRVAAGAVAHTYTAQAPSFAVGAIVGVGAVAHSYLARTPALGSQVRAAAAAHTYLGRVPSVVTGGALSVPAAAHSYTAVAPVVTEVIFVSIGGGRRRIGSTSAGDEKHRIGSTTARDDKTRIGNEDA